MNYFKNDIQNNRGNYKVSQTKLGISGIGVTFTRNGLGVGISMVFKILGHTLFLGG
jgi:hypothetical protein